MPDPVSLVLAGAALGGVGGRVAEKVWDVGERWIASYFEDHHEKAIARAKENAALFIVDLARRMDTIETVLAERGASGADRLLQDPDFAASLKDAILVAARTEAAEKRGVLAELVAERVAAEPESLEALASNLAIHSVGSLAPTHLQTLGCLSLIAGIRPDWFADTAMEERAFASTAESWFDHEFSPYLNMLPPTAIDMWHLDSVSCLTFHPSLWGDLAHELGKGAGGGWSAHAFLKTENGKRILGLWDAYLGSVDLTPAGYLVGFYAHQATTGTKTKLTWPD